jgi:anti-sigma regulatory factor (Ser/Thr protein kinase)
VPTEAHLQLTPTADAPGQARQFIRVTLFEWGHRPAVTLVEAVATELVTNAVVHADGPVELLMRLEGDTLHVAVSDYTINDEMPHLRCTRPGAEHGYGLQIVQSLSIAWGCTPNHDRKSVWADLDLNQPL